MESNLTVYVFLLYLISTTVEPSAAIVPCVKLSAVKPSYVFAAAAVVPPVVPESVSVSTRVVYVPSIFCFICFTVYKVPEAGFHFPYTVIFVLTLVEESTFFSVPPSL